MSNRQARNWRKAMRRRERLLRRDYSITGCDATAELADYGWQFVLAMERPADGWRAATSTIPDRLWRLMEPRVERMVAQLRRWFEENDVQDAAP